MSKIIKKNKGYALVEGLFYIALFSLLSTAVISSLLTMSKSFIEVSAQSELLQSSGIMERISREVRQASSIDATSTTTDLKLNTVSGADTKIEFKLAGPYLQLLENGSITPTGNLNTSNISITNLTFTQITMTKGKAVRIALTVTYVRGTTSRSENFYDTVVLRGSYI